MSAQTSLIPESHMDLLEKPIYVAATTVMPDGQPQSTVVWWDYEGEYIRINSARGRQKDKNLARNPKITILAFAPEDPFHWIEIRGTVEEITEEGAVDHINTLSLKYRGRLYYDDSPESQALKNRQVRVMYRIRPTKVTHS
jgi:PPOX class probable F420-dependent enzyme